jgi:hypothetical protein
MSDEQNEALKKPEDVQALEKILGQFQRYVKTVSTGTFTGASAKDASDLIDYLKGEFDKTYQIYKQHPFIKPFLEEMNGQGK